MLAAGGGCSVTEGAILIDSHLPAPVRAEPEGTLLRVQCPTAPSTGEAEHRAQFKGEKPKRNPFVCHRAYIEGHIRS